MNTSSVNRSLKNIGYLFLARGVDLIIPLVLTPYLIRIIGLENLGVIAFSLAVAGYAGVLIRFGFGITAVRDISRVIDDKTKVAELFNNTWFSSLGLSTICMLIMVGLSMTGVFKDHIVLFMTSFIYIAIQALLPVWLFQSIEKLKFLAIISGCYRSIYILCVLCFVNSPEDYYLVVLLNAICMGSLLLTCMIYITTKCNIKIKMPSLKQIFISIKKSKNAFYTQLAPSLYNNSAVLILGLVSTERVIGVYSAIMGLLEAIISIGRVILSAFTSLIAKDITNHNFFSKVMIITGFLSTVFLVVFSDEVVKVYFNEYNLLAVELLAISSLSVFWGFIFLTYNSGYLMLTGKDVLARNITVFFSLISFIVSLILIYKFEAIGAAIAVVLARFLLGGSSWIFTKRITN
jgi:PST family polysaccharide transporter